MKRVLLSVIVSTIAFHAYAEDNVRSYSPVEEFSKLSPGDIKTIRSSKPASWLKDMFKEHTGDNYGRYTRLKSAEAYIREIVPRIDDGGPKANMSMETLKTLEAKIKADMDGVLTQAEAIYKSALAKFYETYGSKSLSPAQLQAAVERDPDGIIFRLNQAYKNLDLLNKGYAPIVRSALYRYGEEFFLRSSSGWNKSDRLMFWDWISKNVRLASTGVTRTAKELKGAGPLASTVLVLFSLEELKRSGSDLGTGLKYVKDHVGTEGYKVFTEPMKPESYFASGKALTESSSVLKSSNVQKVTSGNK